MAGNTFGRLLLGANNRAHTGNISGAGEPHLLAVTARASFVGYAPLGDYTQYTGFSGNYEIVAHVQLLGVGQPGFYVYVFPLSIPTTVIRAGRTDSAGSVTISNLARGQYRVEMIDPSHTYNSGSFDNVASAPM